MRRIARLARLLAALGLPVLALGCSLAGKAGPLVGKAADAYVRSQTGGAVGIGRRVEADPLAQFEADAERFYRAEKALCLDASRLPARVIRFGAPSWCAQAELVRRVLLDSREIIESEVGETEFGDGELE